MFNKFEEKNVKIIILLISIAVAVLVGLLNWVLPKPENIPTFTQFQPALHAFLNGTVALLLVAGLYLIKNGKKEIHKKVMFSSFVFYNVWVLIRKVFSCFFLFLDEMKS